MTRFAIWSLARLSRSARQVLASREKSRKWPWPGLAYGKAASVGGHLIRNFTCWRVRDMPPNREIVRLSRSEVIVRWSEPTSNISGLRLRPPRMPLASRVDLCNRQLTRGLGLRKLDG